MYECNDSFQPTKAMDKLDSLTFGKTTGLEVFKPVWFGLIAYQLLPII